MKGNLWFIVLILALSAMIRLWDWNPVGILWIPFLIGVFEIFIFFVALKEISGNDFIPKAGSVIAAVLPWHVQQSRILSPELFFLGFLTLGVVWISKKPYLSIRRATVWCLVLAGLIFIVSVAIIPEGVASRVDLQRNAINKSYTPLWAKAFSNKLVESYRYRERLAFESLDIGILFFKGHPRERAGVVETQKLIAFLIPLLAFGIIRLENKVKLIIMSSTAIALAITALAGTRGIGQGFLLIFPIIAVSAYGAETVRSKIFGI